MQLTKCRECNEQVSKNAKSCPHCGAPNPAAPEWMRHISLIVVVLFIVFMAFGVFDKIFDNGQQSLSSQEKLSTITESVFYEGESVTVDHATYAVKDSGWATMLNINPYLDKAPNANWLLVRIIVRNDDNKARLVHSFYLFDENGAEYEESSERWRVDGHFILEKLNPSVSKAGVLLFDVPKGHIYRLKLSGKYGSEDKIFVELSPKG